MAKKSIKRNMLMNIILTVSNFLFPLITYSYVSRVLTPTGVGKVSFVSSVIQYFSYIAILGIPAYGLREASKIRDDKEKLSKLVQELFIINIISTLVSLLLLTISVIIIPKLYDYRLLFVVMSASIFLNTIGVEWLYKALEEYSYITIRSLIFKILYIPLVFLLIHNESNYVMYGFLTIFVTSASYICNFINIRKYISFKKFKNYDLRKHLKPIFILFSASIIISIYVNFDVLMIGFIKNEWTVGLYTVALKLKTLILSVSTAITSVLIPRISKSISKKDISETSRLINISVKTSLLLAIPLAIFVFINAHNTILFLFGDQYIGAYSTLLVLMLCVILLVFTNIFGNQVLIPAGEEKKFTISVLVGLFINLFLNFLLIPKYDSFGAAIGTLVTEFWNMCFMGKYAKKYISNVLAIKKIYKFLISMITAILFGYIFLFIGKNMNLLLNLFIAGIIFFGIYYGSLMLMKEEMLISQLNQIYAKAKLKIKK